MFEFSWNVRARSNMSDWGGLCKCLGVKFPWQRRVALEINSLPALVRNLNERTLTLLEKDFHVVVCEIMEEYERDLI